MTRQPTSEVKLLIRALRTLIYNGELSVDSPGAGQTQIYGDTRRC
jgi:hypothetical protein